MGWGLDNHVLSPQGAPIRVLVSGATTALSLVGLCSAPRLVVHGLPCLGKGGSWWLSPVRGCFGPSGPPLWPLLLIVGTPGLTQPREFSWSLFPSLSSSSITVLFSSFLFFTATPLLSCCFLMARVNLVKETQHLFVLPCVQLYP